jgi:hypothetical protein
MYLKNAIYLHRFVSHLLKLHNIKYEENIHGYKETDDISKIVTERVCPQTDTLNVGPPDTIIVMDVVDAYLN